MVKATDQSAIIAIQNFYKELCHTHKISRTDPHVSPSLTKLGKEYGLGENNIKKLKISESPFTVLFNFVIP